VRGADTDAVALAHHLAGEAARSDVDHVMWLNRNVTKRRVDVDELARLLAARASGEPSNEERVPRERAEHDGDGARR
jgi:hypothetical protein